MAKGHTISFCHLSPIPQLNKLNNRRFCLAGFDELWVSTEDKEIAEEALRSEANVHERPEALAEDETSSVDAVWEFVDRHPGRYQRKV